MWLIEQLAEKYIQEAISHGELDNLSGAGKPLELDDDSFVPPELRAGYRLLKNAGYLPPELLLRKEAIDLSTLLKEVTEDNNQYQKLSQHLALLELKLLQAGLDTSFLHRHDYSDKLHKKITK